MAFLKSLGHALSAPLRAPGMGAITKPINAGLQKTPGLGGVPGALGMGPSAPPPQIPIQQGPPQVPIQQGPIPQMNPQMNRGIGPNQSALQNMAQGAAGMMGGGIPRPMGPSPMQRPQDIPQDGGPIPQLPQGQMGGLFQRMNRKSRY